MYHDPDLNCDEKQIRQQPIASINLDPNNRQAAKWPASREGRLLRNTRKGLFRRLKQVTRRNLRERRSVGEEDEEVEESPVPEFLSDETVARMATRKKMRKYAVLNEGK